MRALVLARRQTHTHTHAIVKQATFRTLSQRPKSAGSGLTFPAAHSTPSTIACNSLSSRANQCSKHAGQALKVSPCAHPNAWATPLACMDGFSNAHAEARCHAHTACVSFGHSPSFQHTTIQATIPNSLLVKHDCWDDVMTFPDECISILQPTYSLYISQRSLVAKLIKRGHWTEDSAR